MELSIIASQLADSYGGEMEDDRGERVYMVWGTDELGDAHMISTSSQERALIAYRDMNTRYESVRYNDAVHWALIGEI
ncbi:hypothetical protein WG901_20915 [Novosphingobium sp. PS1R-30]|uniref:Uncharacterized protein n=1 Tax=Novosphingobium anseongense TaxID=3133436 RepID=A0ABU8S1A9_9SPHN